MLLSLRDRARATLVGWLNDLSLDARNNIGDLTLTAPSAMRRRAQGQGSDVEKSGTHLSSGCMILLIERDTHNRNPAKALPPLLYRGSREALPQPTPVGVAQK
jgi:hypothetical protein